MKACTKKNPENQNIAGCVVSIHLRNSAFHYAQLGSTLDLDGTAQAKPLTFGRKPSAHESR